jgi:ketosteroid isomerase-like protein
MKSLSCLIVASVLVTAGAPLFAQPPAVAAADKPTAETLKRLEREFMAATARLGAKGYLSFYAEDAVEVPDGEDLIRGKVNIAKGMAYLDDKHNQLIWAPVGADISASGDLGYTYGRYEYRSVDKAGKPTRSVGKYTTIWKRQSDGSWKVVLDMGDSSPAKKP